MRNKKDCKAPYQALGTELTKNNIGVWDNKDIDNKHECFLLNFECNFYTIATTIQNHFSVIFTSNSVIFTLCYECVDIFYITKNNSHRQSKGKVYYLG